jgi:hypothetical protein
MKKYNEKQLFCGFVVLFVLFLSAFPRIVGLERVVATFILAILIAYSVTTDWNQSAIFAVGMVFFTSLINSNGPFSDFRENFDVEPAGKDVKDVNSYSEGKTTSMDETDLDEKEIEELLKKDEENEKKNDEEGFKEVGALGELQELLEKAKKDSPFGDKVNYSPAEAQRATYRLIDTVGQLKETMSGMVPLMKTGGNLLQLYKKMGLAEMAK